MGDEEIDDSVIKTMKRGARRYQKLPAWLRYRPKLGQTVGGGGDD